MTTLLLSGGVLAAILFVLVSTVDGATRPGYRLRRHPISALALGSRGWIQTANFLVTGVLLFGAAVGSWMALADDGTGWLLGWSLPVLLGVLAIAVVLSGVFPMDAMRDYPPGSGVAGTASGAMAADQLSRTHRVHDQVGSMVFLGFPVLCFVGAALFFGRPGGFGWGLFGVGAGIALLVLLGRFGQEWEQDGDGIGLVQRSMVVIGMGWIVVLLAHLL